MERDESLKVSCGEIFEVNEVEKIYGEFSGKEKGNFEVSFEVFKDSQCILNFSFIELLNIKMIKIAGKICHLNVFCIKLCGEIIISDKKHCVIKCGFNNMPRFKTEFVISSMIFQDLKVIIIMKF